MNDLAATLENVLMGHHNSEEELNEPDCGICTEAWDILETSRMSYEPGYPTLTEWLDAATDWGKENARAVADYRDGHFGV